MFILSLCFCKKHTWLDWQVKPADWRHCRTCWICMYSICIYLYNWFPCTQRTGNRLFSVPTTGRTNFVFIRFWLLPGCMRALSSFPPNSTVVICTTGSCNAKKVMLIGSETFLWKHLFFSWWWSENLVFLKKQIFLLFCLRSRFFAFVKIKTHNHILHYSLCFLTFLFIELLIWVS